MIDGADIIHGVRGVVLAGGRSRRMGRDKRYLKLAGCTLLEHVLLTLRPLFVRFMAVGPQEELSAIAAVYDLTVSADVLPGAGPLGAIYTALLQVNEPYIFVVACDMPFVSAELARYLCNLRHEADVIVPKIGNYLEPLFAVYSYRCLPAIRDTLLAGKRKVVSFYKQVTVRYVTEEEISRFGQPAELFFNVNTPHDLTRAGRLQGYKKT